MSVANRRLACECEANLPALEERRLESATTDGETDGETDVSGEFQGGGARRRVECPNHVWFMDFIFDTTSNGRPLKSNGRPLKSNGRPLKIFSMSDASTRDCIALEVGRKFNSDDLVQRLIGLLAIGGVPKFIRCDSGLSVRDLCQREAVSEASFFLAA